MCEYKLSLCIPTNGISEWVIPVLTNIYNQHQDETKFEVVITNNGNNSDFDKSIGPFLNRHSNIIYQHTNEILYKNQIACFKLAKGNLIKFVNHRSIMSKNSIQYLLSFEEKYRDTKPIVYFLNGASGEKSNHEYHSFNDFVYNLSYWASWSTGLAFWHDDLDWLKCEPEHIFNYISPHSDLLFKHRNRNYYLIDNTDLMHDLPTDETKKGNYDLFRDWAVEYPSIILDLFRDGDISIETFNHVKKDLEVFNADLYCSYIILRHPSSYDTSTFRKYINVYFSEKSIILIAFYLCSKRIVKKLIDILLRK